MSKAHFGLVGLGVMGENLVLNAERNGFSSVVFNRTYAKTEAFLQGRGAGKAISGASNLQEFVSKLERPRRILLMVKAGPATDAVINDISPHLEKGDLLIDGGNSLFSDTERRVQQLESKSFGYIGMGVSGGAKGAFEGPSMMPGGTKESYDAIEGLLTKMAAQVDDGPCVAYIGPRGSGHFVKTVHNGIEYGIQQILAEAYDLMKRSLKMSCDDIANVFKDWNETEELSSFLVEITEICLRTKDPSDGSNLVEKIVDKAGQKGTGLWTVVSALQLGASVPTIYAALNARVMSSLKKQRVLADSMFKSPSLDTYELGTSSNNTTAIMDAVVLSTIASYAQGIEIMTLASKEYDYNLSMPKIAQIWKGGCIIRSKLLKRIQEAYNLNPALSNLCMDPWFCTQIQKRLPGLSKVVSHASSLGIPVPCFSSTLDYLNSYRTSRLPQNLIQAMRDCFGSHTYERIDMDGVYHTEWL
ncbi:MULTISPECIES: NADP-dependent phosphogluconate dehydrogenase [Prochlorococcus]|uniref:NADP-dependent phosphogluconate dehydrogenase n=1 Tax=Prochlorococcus TaxID=1218 RepID=UPI0005339D11|nr:MULTISPECIES: NADP-dependent phosphogluconate dehydrogenase [Prochlorococcus]KGG12354.1 6-phosphogluconate dehydrogenase [Prochlorococcus sp. MIT 0601]